MKFEVTYAATPAELWRALTDPDELAAWLMPNDFALRLGHKFTFRTRPAPGFDGIVKCEVLEIEPERRLVYSWNGGGHATIVAWSLEPAGVATRLTLEHLGFKGPAALVPRIVLGLGWGRMLRAGMKGRFRRLS